MAKQWEKRVGRFAATDEQGREYWIHVSQTVHDVGTQTEPSATLAGLKTYRTSDGKAVNWIAKGVYEIPLPGGRGIRLRSTATDAP